MRIISGRFKGLRFNPPKNLPVRPTTDFSKTGLFNILHHNYGIENKTVLDLFSGTGNISLEFISRGCKSVTAVDKSPKCTSYLKKITSELKINNLLIINKDVFKFLNTLNSKFDIIFADPPYNHPDIEKLPKMVFEKGILSKNGVFILEHSEKQEFIVEGIHPQKRVFGGSAFTFYGNLV